MHIPDGFLDVKTAAVAGALSAGAVGVSLRQTRLHLPRRKVPLMGLCAAFIFAAQMLNFPVAGGTSGHLVGGVLASVLLGPSAAILVIAAVLFVQCFMFADGGVTALGANVFNMAVVSSVGGYYVYRLIGGLMRGPRGRLVAIAVASWVATVVAAIVCAGELALARTIPWRVALPAMADVHMLIGVGEAVLTTLVIASVLRTRPDLLADDRDAVAPVAAEARTPAGGRFELIAYGLLISLGLAMFVSPWASAWPDGLDRVAERYGFAAREVGADRRLVRSPIPDYKMPGIGRESLATGVAGAVGTLIVFGLAVGLSRVLIPTVRPTGAPDAAAPGAA